MKINKHKLLYRFEQILIFIAHIALLKWILYTLHNGGVLESTTLLLHFVGMGIYGALLIRGCAYLAKKRHLKEISQ